MKTRKAWHAVSSINSAMRVLRRVLTLGVEWGRLEASPKLRLLPGEHHRERVVTQAKRGAISRLRRRC